MPNNEEKVPADGTPASATDTSNKATEQSEFTETVLNLVVAVFFYSILAYAFMFMSHLNPKFEWLIVIVGATVVAFLYIPLSKDSRYVYKVLGPYIVGNGVSGRIHSCLSDLCQRSILPFDCG